MTQLDKGTLPPLGPVRPKTLKSLALEKPLSRSFDLTELAVYDCHACWLASLLLSIHLFCLADLFSSTCLCFFSNPVFSAALTEHFCVKRARYVDDKPNASGFTKSLRIGFESRTRD